MSELWIGCNGEIHSIELTKRGRLVLKNHAGTVNDELAMLALGGTVPECIRILNAWRRQDLREVPWELESPLVTAITRRRLRAEKRDQDVDPLTRPLRERLLRRVLEIVDGIARKASYALACDRSIWLRIGETPSIQSGVLVSWFPRTKRMRRSGYMDITVKPSWFKAVYKRGIALTSRGHLVIDVIEDRPDGSIIVLAGRPDTSGRIHARRAVILPDGRAGWIKEHKGAGNEEQCL